MKKRKKQTISQSLIVEYNQKNSIFCDLDIKETARIVVTASAEFCEGFYAAEKSLQNLNLSGITIINFHIVNNLCSHTVSINEIDENSLETWSKENRFDDLVFVKALYVIYKIQLIKKYILLLSWTKTNLIFIQFNSLNFLDGFTTYMTWTDSAPKYVHNVFDNFRPYKLNYECQLPIVTKRSIVKTLLAAFFSSDLVEEIWNYVVHKCEFHLEKINSMRCINEMDIINTRKRTHFRYTVFEDISNNIGILKLYTNETNTFLKCSYCKMSRTAKPVVCKTTLVYLFFLFLFSLFHFFFLFSQNLLIQKKTLSH